MNIVCSPAGIVDIVSPGQGTIDLINGKFNDVLLDLSQFCLPDEIENLERRKRSRSYDKSRTLIAEDPSKLPERVQAVTKRWKQEGLHASIAYAPYLPRDTKKAESKELIRTLTLLSIEEAGKMNCQAIVIRPWFAGIEKEQEWYSNKEFYLSYIEKARENNLMILLENQCRNRNGHLVRGICSDPLEAASWVDALNEAAKEERFGFCMDVGVCNLCGQDMSEFMRPLGQRIKAIILRDCNGSRENAMLPFTCVDDRQSQTDWLSLIRALRDLEFNGHLIMNLYSTALAFSPVLRPDLLKLAHSVAAYFVWQAELEQHLRRYSSIVLFGAGNMCRNYMKCYGKTYKPLFTCDNNSRLWGTKFCGLEVNSPDQLKSIPKDCGIFICNVYYREIQQQLWDMGIENPIEFFNDEYMPSFYYDRLE
ncbi:MAG: sugar phosphate isomerase/epimerase family protein [Lachnospiraceae bacterium]